MTAQIKGILFDKDGTLFGFNDTWATWSVSFLTSLAPDDPELCLEMAKLVGFNWDTMDFETGSVAVNASVDVQCVLLASIHPDLDAKAIEKLAFTALKDTAAIPVCDLDPLLADFNTRGFRLGIATNDFEQSAVNQMQGHNIYHHFDFICGFDSGYTPKPQADMILGFCEKMRLTPDQIAMVGDSTHDLEAGRKAGVGLNVGVLTGPAKRDDIKHLADVILPDISTLPELFKG
ncbi:MAG: HAD family hydrolase [Rhodobacterales bacterium]